MKFRKLEIILVVFVLLLTLSYVSVFAANWPSKSINVIVAWSPGGGTDRLARAVAPLLEEKLGVPIVVLNRPGGTGVVGHTALAQAKPDGYTIGIITPQLVTGPILKLTELSYHDVLPIALLNSDPAAVTVNSEAEWDTLNDFLDYAKNHPNEVRIGNSGPGGTWHMVAVSLGQITEAEFIHVPFDGAAPAITALLGNHIEAVTVSAVEAAPQIEGGLLKMLAVTSAERFDKFPDVPTAIEQGVNIDMGTWRGIAAPKGTPKEILEKLETAMEEILKSPKFVEFMNKEGIGIRFLGSEDFNNFLAVQEKAYISFYESQNQ